MCTAQVKGFRTKAQVTIWVSSVPFHLQSTERRQVGACCIRMSRKVDLNLMPRWTSPGPCHKTPAATYGSFGRPRTRRRIAMSGSGNEGCTKMMALVQHGQEEGGETTRRLRRPWKGGCFALHPLALPAPQSITSACRCSGSGKKGPNGEPYRCFPSGAPFPGKA